MLVMPHGGNSSVIMLGIDPGSTTLGVGMLTVDLSSWAIQASQAWTLNGDKLAGRNSWMESVHGGRISRIDALEAELLNTFRTFRPFDISSESPFINNKFPQAGIALTEVLTGIRRAVTRYDMWKTLHLVDPPTVKNAVGVKGNKGGPDGKLLMQQAVLRLSQVLNYNGSISMDQLDEHSIDALAVVYGRYKTLTEQLCLASPGFPTN